MAEGVTLAKLSLLIPTLKAEIHQRSMDEGMRKTAPPDRNWAQQAKWHGGTTHKQTSQTHNMSDVTSAPDEGYSNVWQADAEYYSAEEPSSPCDVQGGDSSCA